jgi:hypothetical protein
MFSTPKTRVVRAAMLAVCLSATGTIAVSPAGAAESVQDEKNRTPVFYSAETDCNGDYSCVVDLMTTPTKRRRVELSSITCYTAAADSGYVVRVALMEETRESQRAVHLLDARHQWTTKSVNGDVKGYIARSEAKFRLRKNGQYSILAGSTAGLTTLNCYATGDLIEYRR